MLRFSLHRIIWVGSQITRSEGREDYSEVSYFFKDFSKFVPPATPQKSGPKCAPRVAPCSGCAPGAPPLATPAMLATQAIDHRVHLALIPRSRRALCHQNVRCPPRTAASGGPTKSSVPSRPLPDSAGLGIRHCVAVSAHSQLSLVGVRGVASGALCLWCKVAAGLVNLRWCWHKRADFRRFFANICALLMD